MAIASTWIALEQMLKNYGLGDLTDWAKAQFVQGKSPDEISLALEQQPAFKARYSAIFDRRAAGLPPVSVDDINNYRTEALALEHTYGLPSGLISDMQHVNNAVANDISFNELQTRVTLGANEAMNQPPEVRDWLQKTYGIGAGGLVAYFTDPNHALPFLEKQATAAMVAGSAQRQGFGALNQTEAEMLATAGVSQSQADQGFGQLYKSQELLNPLAGSAEQAIGRDTQLGVVQGEAPAVAALQKQAAGRVAVFQEGGTAQTSRKGLAATRSTQ